MKNGQLVARFERAFAEYVGAKYAIALCNGTATLHTALVALGVKPGDRVAVPPLTMSSTALAVLHAGAVPQFIDVDAQTWLMREWPKGYCIPVSLYGLTSPLGRQPGRYAIVDAAQTLAKYQGNAFTSYSFQASKILALSEGGMLVTDDIELAQAAREFSSLGYDMQPNQPRIDPAVLKHPTYERHLTFGWNYRMSDLVAAKGLELLERAPMLLSERRACAALYRDAIGDCSWLKQQLVPEGWTHDYWTFAVALASPAIWDSFVATIVKYGGERPYAAWRLAYMEPVFDGRMVATQMEGVTCTTNDPFGFCPIAESLQPRLVQFQTNDSLHAHQNALALRRAIDEIEHTTRARMTL